MITLKTEEQIEKMYIANQIVKNTLELVEKHIKPGVSTKYLDEIAEDYIRSQNAIPNFKNYNIDGFAVVSAIMAENNVKEATQNLKSIINNL